MAKKLGPRDQLAADRFADRRRREDGAPRLAREVPGLETLKLELDESRTAGVMADSVHVRRVVIASAPALFEVTCTNPACEDGGHDITRSVLASLRNSTSRFEGEDNCHGYVRGNPCGRMLKYVGLATYQPQL